MKYQGVLLNQIENLLIDLSLYSHGADCLIGFLLSWLEKSPAYHHQDLLQALQADMQSQLEHGRTNPNLLPFLRLEAQLLGRAGDPIESPGLPKELVARFPRLNETVVPHLQSVDYCHQIH